MSVAFGQIVGMAGFCFQPISILDSEHLKLLEADILSNSQLIVSSLSPQLAVSEFSHASGFSGSLEGGLPSRVRGLGVLVLHSSI